MAWQRTNRPQQDVIMYLKEENKALREKLGKGILKIRVSLVPGYWYNNVTWPGGVALSLATFALDGGGPRLVK